MLRITEIAVGNSDKKQINVFLTGTDFLFIGNFSEMDAMLTSPVNEIGNIYADILAEFLIGSFLEV
jgi:hypothetical protein